MEKNQPLIIIGEQIRSFRKSKKISQETLAELSKLHPTYISNIERGMVNASIITFYKIAKALGFTLSQLLDMPVSSDSFNKDRNKNFEFKVFNAISKARNLENQKQIIFIKLLESLADTLHTI